MLTGISASALSMEVLHVEAQRGQRTEHIRIVMARRLNLTTTKRLDELTTTILVDQRRYGRQIEHLVGGAQQGRVRSQNGVVEHFRLYRMPSARQQQSLDLSVERDPPNRRFHSGPSPCFRQHCRIEMLEPSGQTLARVRIDH